MGRSRFCGAVTWAHPAADVVVFATELPLRVVFRRGEPHPPREPKEVFCLSQHQASRVRTKKLVICAVLIALHEVLCLVGTISIGNFLSITVSGITEVIAGLMFGPWTGLAVGGLGSLLNQLLKYGFGPTTLLWILPAAVKGFLCGLYAHRVGYELNHKRILLITAVTAVIVTTINTGVMVLDARFYHYSTKALELAGMALRYVNGFLTSVLYMAVTEPLLRQVAKVVPDVKAMRDHFPGGKRTT